MAETNTPGEKKLSVPSKTLSLKPRTETGTVRQSFSHGRSKQVVVEKVKSRTAAPTKPQAEAAPPAAPAAPSPGKRTTASPRVAAAPPQPAPSPQPPSSAPKPPGMLLRSLTDEERSRRAHALGDARLREAEERKIA